jgi:hypothetical protein
MDKFSGPQSGGWYKYAAGACDDKVRWYDSDEVNLYFWNIRNLIVYRDGLDLVEVHKELFRINEYRKYCTKPSWLPIPQSHVDLFKAELIAEARKAGVRLAEYAEKYLDLRAMTDDKGWQ